MGTGSPSGGGRAPQLHPDRAGPARAVAGLAATTGRLAGTAQGTLTHRYLLRVVVGCRCRRLPGMVVEPFKYKVAPDDECHVLLRFPDGDVIAMRVLSGSELVLDGPPGKRRGDGGPDGT